MTIQRIAELEAEVMGLRKALEITHELYAQASMGYGFAHPDNPHNFSPDFECCNADEIAAHSQACEDFDAGRPIKKGTWGVGTYTDEYAPAVELLSTPFSPTALPELIEKVEKMTIERCVGACAAQESRFRDARNGVAAYGSIECQEAVKALPTGQIKLEDLL